MFSGDIVAAIRDGIRNAVLFVADLTGYSPNVMYELGIAHALDKDSVLLIHNPDGEIPPNLPFDIQAQRIHAYAIEESLEQVLRLHIPPV